MEILSNNNWFVDFQKKNFQLFWHHHDNPVYLDYTIKRGYMYFVNTQLIEKVSVSGLYHQAWVYVPREHSAYRESQCIWIIPSSVGICTLWTLSL